MRILHTESMGVPGGQTRRVVEEAKIIQEAGHQVWLACRPDTWLQEQAQEAGIETIPMPLIHTVDPKSLGMIFKEIRKKNIDIVHSHDSKDSYSAAIACKMTGRKFIRARHNDLVKRPGPIYKIADGIVTTGSKIKRELMAYGISGDKIVSIPSFPDERLFIPDNNRRQKFRKEWNIDDRIVIGTLGGLNRRKRPEFILSELVQIVRKYPNVLYLIAGPEAKEGFEIEFHRLVEFHQLQNHVRFLGFTDAATFLDAIDIYLCPSRKEGVPQALMQAMMMGKAVVASRIGGIPDLNIENNLFLAEREQPRDYGQALMTLITDDTLRQSIGMRNRSLSLRHFSRSHLAEQLLDFYSRILKQ